MGDVIVKPVAVLDTPEGRRFATEVDGCVVHGDKPMTPEGRTAMSEIIAAAKRQLRK